MWDGGAISSRAERGLVGGQGWMGPSSSQSALLALPAGSPNSQAQGLEPGAWRGEAMVAGARARCAPWRLFVRPVGLEMTELEGPQTLT